MVFDSKTVFDSKMVFDSKTVFDSKMVFDSKTGFANKTVWGSIDHTHILHYLHTELARKGKLRNKIALYICIIKILMQKIYLVKITKLYLKNTPVK